MFREMLRRRQALPQAECEEILRRGLTGVLAVQGDDGYPYAVPLNYVYHNGRIYFHGGSKGHRKDAMRRCDKVSFCVIGQDKVMPVEYTDYYRSVIVFGRLRELSDREETLALLRVIGERVNPGDEAAYAVEMAKEGAAARVQELTIEHMSGKEAIELTHARTADAK